MERRERSSSDNDDSLIDRKPEKGRPEAKGRREWEERKEVAGRDL